MFLCVYDLRRVIAMHWHAMFVRRTTATAILRRCGSLLVSGRSATDAALAKLKESNLRFAMSEVSKLKPIAARRMDTAQAQHPSPSVSIWSTTMRLTRNYDGPNETKAWVSPLFADLVIVNLSLPC